MTNYLPLGKYSFGMGDRFAHQGKAQLQACILASELGADVVPVWNKSNREHTFTGTDPASLLTEADAAVKALGWKKPYHVDEFCAPYASVIDIDKKKLPPASVVNSWSSQQFTDAPRHDRKNPAFNPIFRQLLHVSFKVAAKMGGRYLGALKKHDAAIAKNVATNLFDRHLKPLLLGK